MNKFLKIASATLLVSALAGAASAAISDPAEYVASYKGRTDVPVPVSIKAPKAVDADGQVTLEFVVSEAGTPEKLAVKSSTDASLDSAALDAVSTWKFEPLKKNGKAVATKVLLPVNFVAAD